MSVIYIVLPLALVFVVLAVLVFLRQVQGGQYDDLDTPAVRMLHDDDAASPSADREEPRKSER